MPRLHIDYLALLKSLLPLWPFFLIVAFLALASFVINQLIPYWMRQRKFKGGFLWRSDRDLIQWLRMMKPTEFEQYIAYIFKSLGYKTFHTGGSHDGGIDVVAEKDGIKNFIQCKKFMNRQVTLGDVREFYGALVDHLANGKGYFITTNKFTLEASKFVEDKPIELIDEFDLVRYIKKAGKAGEYLRPTESPLEPKMCPHCGGKLVEKNGKYGPFIGCSNYPKCRFTEKK